MSVKTTFIALVIAIGATLGFTKSAAANPIKATEQLGQCHYIAEMIINKFEVDIMFSEKWDMESVQEISDVASQKLYVVVDEAVKGKSDSVAVKIEKRLVEVYEAQEWFAIGYAGGGLSSAVDYMFDKCQTFLDIK